jgi:peptidoglycan/LPS O-acetylase OafA/YrhL
LSTVLFLLALTLVLVSAFPRGPVFYDHFYILGGIVRVKYALVCFLIVAIFAFYDVPDRVWRIPLVFIGNISYSVYLLHPFAFQAAKALLPQAISGKIRFPVALGITIIFAALVYHFIEKPAIRLGKRLAGA